MKPTIKAGRPKATDPRVNIHARIPQSLLEGLDTLCSSSGNSRGELIEIALLASFSTIKLKKEKKA